MCAAAKSPELREEFIGIYCDQGKEEAGRWLQLHHPGIEADELEHRLGHFLGAVRAAPALHHVRGHICNHRRVQHKAP